MRAAGICLPVLVLCWNAWGAEIKVLMDHNDPDVADRRFTFGKVPPPILRAEAFDAVFTVVDGELDANCGGLEALHDRKLPRNEDDPQRNFFFRADTDGGRLLVDLGQARDLKRIATYSWHAGARAPQLYALFAARGDETNLNTQIKRPIDPKSCGWMLLANVDTRPADKQEAAGQYGASVSASEGAWFGPYRYLLFDIFRTENSDAFGNTFFSEVEILGTNAPEPSLQRVQGKETFTTNAFEITVDASATPALRDWALQKVGPMAQLWYPELVRMLPSSDFTPSKTVTIILDPEMRGVAATSGARIRCAAKWLQNNLQGEALGAVFHELVHVVQQYRRAKELQDGAVRPPGWLVEGIADYLRWYRFEPDSSGAQIHPQGIAQAHFDGSYRVTANFLNWATENYAKDLVPQLNRAIRQGEYRPACWKNITGHELEELGTEWKSSLERNGSQPREAKHD